MDGYFNGNAPSSDPNSVNKLQKIQSDIAQVFTFLDEQELSIDDGYFGEGRAPDNRWINMPADRHTMGGDLAFADGHCEHWRWKYQKVFTFSGMSTANSDDIDDLRRIQAGLPPLN